MFLGQIVMWNHHQRSQTLAYSKNVPNEVHEQQLVDIFHFHN